MPLNMPDNKQEKISQIVKKSTVKNESFKATSTIPALKDKLKLKVSPGTDSIYWYIKFNIPLNPETVSNETMAVTETNGYILSTLIDYDAEQNRIIIMPIDKYEQDIFYILNISKKVESEKGQKLKYEIHILFKIIGNQISEYQVLKNTVKVPKPKPKPRQMKQPSAKIYSTGSDSFQGKEKHTLPFGEIKLNILVGLLGILLTITGLFMLNTVLMGIGAAIGLLGVIHVAVQFMNKSVRSAIFYNLGVFLFNRGKYDRSMVFFKKSLHLNADNEMAEYAVAKNKFYDNES